MKTWKNLVENLQFSPSRLVGSIKNVSSWWGTWFSLGSPFDNPRVA